MAGSPAADEPDALIASIANAAIDCSLAMAGLAAWIEAQNAAKGARLQFVMPGCSLSEVRRSEMFLSSDISFGGGPRTCWTTSSIICSCNRRRPWGPYPEVSLSRIVGRDTELGSANEAMPPYPQIVAELESRHSRRQLLRNAATPPHVSARRCSSPAARHS